MADAISDVVILVPGFGGSVLERDGKAIWGAAGPAGLGGLLAGGRDAVEALRLADDDPSRAEVDGVRATRVVSGPHMLPGVWKIEDYSRIPALVGRLVELEPGGNYVEFPWDWRRDLRAAARALAKEAETRLAAWAERSGTEEPKLVIIAHSAGAVVARYFLEALDGWKQARALVTFGAPLRGTPAAVGALTGMSLPRAAVEGGLVDVLRSFTSLHQLLPSYPVVQMGEEGELMTVDGAAIEGLDAGRVAMAAALRADMDEALGRHANNPAYRESHYALHSIVGTAQTTPQSARVTDGTIELLHSYQHRDLSGDGIVPRMSAQPAGQAEQHATLLTSARHAELHTDDRALSYLLGIVASVFVGAGPATPPVRSRVGIDIVVPDVAAVGEPFRVRVLPEEGTLSGLRATLERADTGERVAEAELHPVAERWHEGTLTAAAPGIHRVRLQGGEEVQPVADIMEVLA
ncbi:MAG TPA: hypothetical protein VGE02_01080 [Gemmatimonadales bacterium]